MNYEGSTCICRVPKAQLRPGTFVECVHCGRWRREGPMRLTVQAAVVAALLTSCDLRHRENALPPAARWYCAFFFFRGVYITAAAFPRSRPTREKSAHLPIGLHYVTSICTTPLINTWHTLHFVSSQQLGHVCGRLCRGRRSPTGGAGRDAEHRPMVHADEPRRPPGLPGMWRSPLGLVTDAAGPPRPVYRDGDLAE